MKLQFKVNAILVFFLILIFLIALGIFGAIYQLKSDTSGVNQATPLQTVGLRIVHLGLVATSGKATQKHRRELDALMRLFDRLCQGLGQGDVSMKLKGTTSPQTRRMLIILQDRWTLYRAALKKTRNSPPDPEAVQYIQTHRTELMSTINEVVAAFDPRDLTQVRLGNIVKFSLMVFFTFLMILVLVRTAIIRPMETLAAATQRVADGDFKVRVPEGPGDEIETLGTNFNQMVQRIRKARADLIEQEEKYRDLYEHSPDGNFSIDADKRIVVANQTLLDMLSMRAEDLLGKKKLTDLMTTEEAEEFLTYWPTYKRNRSIRDLEFDMIRQDGSKLPVRLSAREISGADEDSFAGFQCIARDTSERRQLEDRLRQSQKMETVGTLAGGIAHDFNNILASILGNVCLVLEKLGPDHPDTPLLKDAEEAAGRGAELIQSLRTFSRRTVSNPRPLNLNTILNESVRVLKRILPENLQIDCRPASDLGVVEADSTQMQQVIMNLCINARDAMPEGGKLILKTENYQTDSPMAAAGSDGAGGKFVVLSVEDTGVGMSRRVQDRIFEPFFTTKQTGQGTGLGLAMVYGIVTGHYGWINVSSEPGRGTRVIIFLPVTTKPLIETVQKPEPEVQGGSETLLIVEDEPDVLQLLQRMLQRYGYPILACDRGEKAVEMYRARTDEIALVILDMIMPGMGGREACREILKIDPDAKILFSSGYTLKGSEKELCRLGAKGLVQKPYRPSDLAHRVRQILDEK